jgi:Co/Zn/Cd efflux system component
MSGSCCGHDVAFDGLSADYKRRLWAVIALNGGMFLVEMFGGALAGSRALQADALDFLGDTLTYGVSLVVIGAAVPVRAWAALAKGISLTVMGVGVFAWTAYHVLVLGVPKADLMGGIGFMALAANLASVLLLMKYKDGDANVRSVWLCSRNDAIGNVAVMVASGAPTPSGRTSRWPPSWPRCFCIPPSAFCSRQRANCAAGRCRSRHWVIRTSVSPVAIDPPRHGRA